MIPSEPAPDLPDLDDDLTPGRPTRFGVRVTMRAAICRARTAITAVDLALASGSTA
jgi:hypothetical protein